MTLSVMAASAAVYPSYIVAPRGVRTLTLRESEARAFRPGGYVEYEGRMWKIAARRASDDWFKDEVYVTLHGAHYVEGGVFTNLLAKLPSMSAGWLDERVAWLEDV